MELLSAVSQLSCHGKLRSPENPREIPSLQTITDLLLSSLVGRLHSFINALPLIRFIINYFNDKIIQEKSKLTPSHYPQVFKAQIILYTSMYTVLLKCGNIYIHIIYTFLNKYRARFD